MSRTIVGYFNGRNGTLEVYHSAPEHCSLYYKSSSGGSVYTGFTFKRLNTYTGPDGRAYYSDNNVVKAIERRYIEGKI